MIKKFYNRFIKIIKFKKEKEKYKYKKRLRNI